MKSKELEFLELPEQYSGLDIPTYAYFDNLLNKRTILFNTYVDEDVFERLIVPLRNFERDDSNEPVTLLIQSGGGSVLDGLPVLNIIDNYSKPLNIIFYGYLFSMAIIFASAGNDNPNVTKYCHPFSYGLLHAGTVAIQPSEAKSALDAMAFNDRVDSVVKNYVVTHTNISEQEYTENERKQYYMDAAQLKEKGFIDKIIGVDTDGNL